MHFLVSEVMRAAWTVGLPNVGVARLALRTVPPLAPKSTSRTSREGREGGLAEAMPPRIVVAERRHLLRIIETPARGIVTWFEVHELPKEARATGRASHRSAEQPASEEAGSVSLPSEHRSARGRSTGADPWRGALPNRLAALDPKVGERVRSLSVEASLGTVG